MAFQRLEFTKDWTNPTDFPTYEGTESQVREDMQLLHDETKAAFNGLLDDLESGDSLGAVKYKTNDIKYVRLNSDRVIETSSDGINWQASGSSGHIIIDGTGNELPQRGRLKFAGTIITDDGTQTVVTALKGDKGDTGEQGPTGPQGVQGIQGPQGKVFIPTVNSAGVITWTLSDQPYTPPAQSIRGPQGIQGVAGPQGQTGATGPQGIQGIQGPQGQRGPQGNPGTQGPQGPTGATGATGTQGPQGPQGLKGDDGADGRSFTVLALYATLLELQTAHPTGAAGDAYAVGTTGNNYIYIWDVDEEEWTNIGQLQGPQGPQGPQGAQGVQGPSGTMSIGTVTTGEAGTSASVTNSGTTENAIWNFTIPRGDTGAQGIQGIQGPQGEQGETGATGATGAPGAAGKSAYTAAQEAGYTGTEAQFNASLSGLGGLEANAVRGDIPQTAQTDVWKSQARDNIGLGFFSVVNGALCITYEEA